MAQLGLAPPASQGQNRPNAPGSGTYTYPQAPAGASQVYAPLSGGYYNQMAQQMAGPGYAMPHFQFSGLNALGAQGAPGGPGNTGPFQGGPGTSGPPSGMGTGLGPYAFGGSGNGNLGGMGSYAPFVGNGGSYGNNSFPGSLTLGGGNVTGGYSPSSPLGSLIGGMLGGTVGGLPGALLGHVLGNSFGGGTGGLTLPNGTTLPTQNMNLPPTSIPMPTQNINLAQPIINPATGMPYGTAYGETPAGQQALNTERNFSNQANSFTQEAMNPDLWGGRHLRI